LLRSWDKGHRVLRLVRGSLGVVHAGDGAALANELLEHKRKLIEAIRVRHAAAHPVSDCGRIAVLKAPVASASGAAIPGLDSSARSIVFATSSTATSAAITGVNPSGVAATRASTVAATFSTRGTGAGQFYHLPPVQVLWVVAKHLRERFNECVLRGSDFFHVSRPSLRLSGRESI
jgi:hypothetical protein